MVTLGFEAYGLKNQEHNDYGFGMVKSDPLAVSGTLMPPNAEKISWICSFVTFRVSLPIKILVGFGVGLRSFLTVIHFHSEYPNF